MPKILYLHGLNSFLQEDRRAVLEVGAEVFAPELDYLNTPNLFEDLLKKYHNVDAIVGTSAGGLVAYYLAQRLSTPCLLFNPAITHRHELPFSVEFNKEYNAYIQVVIGVNDEVIPAGQALKMFLGDIVETTQIEIHLINRMQHKFDISIFEREWKAFCHRVF